MSYLGYRVKIGNDIIPDTMISRGSYSAKTEERMVASWEDSTMVTHQAYSTTTRTTINFTIRERTMSEQATLAPILSARKNLSVTYWDDLSASYKSGSFYMNNPSISDTFADANGIEYGATQITLTEY